MRRLADAIYDFIDRHDADDPRLVLEALKEARHLARLAVDSSSSRAVGNAAVAAVSQLEARLHQRAMIPNARRVAIDVTPGGPNGRDTEGRDPDEIEADD